MSSTKLTLNEFVHKKMNENPETELLFIDSHDGRKEIAKCSYNKVLFIDKNKIEKTIRAFHKSIINGIPEGGMCYNRIEYHLSL